MTTLSILLVLAGAAAPAPPDQPYVELYDVRDIAERTVRRGEELVTRAGEEPERDVDALIAAEVRGLAELVARCVEPPLEETEGSVAALDGGQLLVRGNAAQQLRARDVLQAQREFDGLYGLEVTFVLAEPGRLSDEPPDEPPDESARVVAPETLRELLERAEEIGATRVSSPRLATFPRRRAMVSVQSPMSYVSSWSVHRVEPHGETVLDPLVEVVDEGLFVDVRLAPLGGGLHSVDLAFTYCDVARPVSSRTILVEGHRVEVSEPDVTRVELASLLELSDPGAAVFHAQVAADRELFVLVRLDAAAGADELRRFLGTSKDRR